MAMFLPGTLHSLRGIFTLLNVYALSVTYQLFRLSRITTVSTPATQFDHGGDTIIFHAQLRLGAATMSPDRPCVSLA